MPEPSFTVEHCSDAEIRVAHFGEGHKYTFSFTTDNKGRVILVPRLIAEITTRQHIRQNISQGRRDNLQKQTRVSVGR